VNYLLDVSVLLALCYEPHVHHDRAEQWLNEVGRQKPAVNLATCSITEIGFVRIACVGEKRLTDSIRTALADLKRMRERRMFIFLDDVNGAAKLPPWVERSKQVTDGHLIALAAEYGGTLVTLDRGIPGALLIPEHVEGPLMVREPSVGYGCSGLDRLDGWARVWEVDAGRSQRSRFARNVT
jgi:predicted nucleic acid-binding protein